MQGVRSRHLPFGIQSAALRKLRLLNAARQRVLRFGGLNHVEPGVGWVELLAKPIISAAAPAWVSLRSTHHFCSDTGMGFAALNPSYGDWFLGIAILEDLRVPPGNRYFGISDGFFLALQADHDLMERRRRIAPALKSIRPRIKAE